jgi:hypothetical protein
LEQEALADSLISNLGGKVDEGVQAASETEIGKRIAELGSGKAKTTSWGELRRRNLEKLPDAWTGYSSPKITYIRATWSRRSYDFSRGRHTFSRFAGQKKKATFLF